MIRMMREDQRDVIACLSTPATYGAPVTSVDRTDTHSAVVFLAGDRAYKLKRAVRYSYLDFSTQTKRRAACEAEVKLNRRTAPDIYLGVLAVTREPDGTLALGGTGPPVDWVVEMVRFDEEMLFDRLATRHALAVELMPQLARVIAGFHASAEWRFDHGGRAGIARVIDGNTRGLAEHGAKVLDPNARAHLSTMAHAALDQQSALLEARRDSGYVRRCHGDLHLRNIVLLGAPTLFDAIEFNDEIACVDVLYDLAFLLMDLWRRGLPEHANIVLNDYLAATADLGGLPLLPLFLSCRAAVRAMTSVTAASLQRDQAQADQLNAAARNYLVMAQDLLRPAPPRLIAIGGLPGSGKTTLARRLAPGIGAAPGALIVRSDLLRKSLCGVAPTTRLGKEGYTREVTRRVYRSLGERAGVAVRAGHSVIVDAVFADPLERAAIAEVARAAGVPFTGLWLQARPEVLAARLQRRRADASDATPSVLRQQLFQGVGPVSWHHVDASDR